MSHCHKLSKQVRSQLKKLDDVEQSLIKLRVEKTFQFKRSSHEHIVVTVPLDDVEFVLVSRYEGEFQGPEKRKVIHWDYAFSQPRKPSDKPKHKAFGEAILEHVVAIAVVSAVASIAGFAYKNWHHITNLIL